MMRNQRAWQIRRRKERDLEDRMRLRGRGRSEEEMMRRRVWRYKTVQKKFKKTKAERRFQTLRFLKWEEDGHDLFAFSHLFISGLTCVMSLKRLKRKRG